MWPFDRAKTGSVTQTDTLQAPPGTPGPSADRLRALEEQVTALAKQVRDVETEWLEWYDKFRRLYARIAKRQERDEVAEAAQTDKQSHQDALGRTNGVQPVSGGPFPRRNY